MKTKRTDPHRPGAIVPAEYVCVLNYALPSTCDGWIVPGFGVNCCDDDDLGNIQHSENGQCCVAGLREVAKVEWAATGGLGKCSVCGACYNYGDVWRHEPTGQHIHIGHDCAEKYGMMTDRSAFELELGRRREAAAKEVQKKINQEQRQAFLDRHPGLQQALQTNHHIVQDIAQRFQQYRQLSDKQVALVLKIAHDDANPKPAEQHVPAPEGRLEVEGTVVSTKTHESQFGTCIKMTVKVETSNGSWLCWGTAPDCLLGGNQPLRGQRIRFTATLTRGRDAHFALFKRPSKAQKIETQNNAEVTNG